MGLAAGLLLASLSLLRYPGRGRKRGVFCFDMKMMAIMLIGVFSGCDANPALP